MPQKERIHISEDRYRWAIRRAGLDLDDFVNKHPRFALTQWMEGTKQPTTKQLEEFAKSVNVPYGFLLLDNAPEESIPFPVFRGDARRHDHFDLNVYDTVNAVQVRQEWLEDYLRDNDIDTCTFVGTATLNTPITDAVMRLRKCLDLDTRWAFALANTNAAVNKLTEMLEFKGVFVAYNGVVGNNTHRVLQVNECRGFALVNKVAPYIFVNSGDAPTAQLFTLIHETAHLMLGVSAGHAASDDTICPEVNERWCDRVAAEFLVPASELNLLWNGKFKDLAKRFKVSDLVIARRAHDLNLISSKELQVFFQQYKSRPIPVKRRDGGGSFYRTSVKRVGRLFAVHVKNAVGSRQLSYVEAYRLTGLFGKTYAQFMNNFI